MRPAVSGTQKKKKKRKETLLRLGPGRGYPALGSQVKSGATATMQGLSILLVSFSPPRFDPLCSLRCGRLPMKADPTHTPVKVWKCSSLSTYTQGRKGRRFFWLEPLALASQRVVPLYNGHSGGMEARKPRLSQAPVSLRAVERPPPVSLRPSLISQ